MWFGLRLWQLAGSTLKDIAQNRSSQKACILTRSKITFLAELLIILNYCRIYAEIIVFFD